VRALDNTPKASLGESGNAPQRRWRGIDGQYAVFLTASRWPPSLNPASGDPNLPILRLIAKSDDDHCMGRTRCHGAVDRKGGEYPSTIGRFFVLSLPAVHPPACGYAPALILAGSPLRSRVPNWPTQKRRKESAHAALCSQPHQPIGSDQGGCSRYCCRMTSDPEGYCPRNFFVSWRNTSN
jgi:hypothetical protein